MAIIVGGGPQGNKGDGRKFPLPPIGQHPAVCVDVIDMGTETSNWNGEERVSQLINLAWEIGAERADGRRFVLYKRYKAYLSKNSWLRKDLESWRGTPFDDSELVGFPVDKLIGKPCEVKVIHVTGNNGKTYANVETVLPPKAIRLTPSGKYVRVIGPKKDASDSEPVPSYGATQKPSNPF